MDIQSVDQLIKSLLNNGRKCISYQCKNLLASGENYGSLMLDIKIKLEKDGKEETVYCVAKTTPPSEVIWKIFNTSVTFKKEIYFYQQIVPTLNEFGNEKGIINLMPFFAKCVGARISLDPIATEVDRDAVLLLENTNIRGFSTADRFVGFNMEETKLILGDLAVFHAAPLAFKLQRPEEFKKKIRPYLNRDFVFTPDEEVFIQFMSIIKTKMSTIPDVSHLYQKIEETARKTLQLLQQPLEPNEIYATMVHNDYWVNNTMLKYENRKAIENIMVDFQMIEYNSPATDLVFFLYSSVQVEILRDNVDYFIKYYFDIFIDTLQRLGCNTDKFTYESFLEDINFIAKNYQVHHVIFMLNPIYTKKGEAKDLSALQNEEDILIDHNCMHENYVKRLHFLVSDFERRGWL